MSAKKKFVLLGSLVLSLILSSCVIPTSDDLTPIPVNQIRTFPTIGVKSIASNKAWTPYIEIMSGVQMALVPPGCFFMGAAEDQIDYLMGFPGSNMEFVDYEDQLPTHKVCFEEPFWIDVFEVTQAQFSELEGQSAKGSYFLGDDLPREQLT